MYFTMEAACGSNKGKIRSNNEDNFFFDNRCLDVENSGLRHCLTTRKMLQKEQFLAVFDGIGGGNYGEQAAFAAADCARAAMTRFGQYVLSETDFLNSVCKEMNSAVLESAKAHYTSHMGATMASILFSYGFAYVCNLGDSRVYRMRDGVLLQLSVDHVGEYFMSRGKKTKAPLSQHLGIPEDEFVIEPYIAKGNLKRGDQYLICSDGLTDMLADAEIRDIMCAEENAGLCVESLIEAALEKGGRDNTTCIIANIL